MCEYKCMVNIDRLWIMLHAWLLVRYFICCEWPLGYCHVYSPFKKVHICIANASGDNPFKLLWKVLSFTWSRGASVYWIVVPIYTLYIHISEIQSKWNEWSIMELNGINIVHHFKSPEHHFMQTGNNFLQLCGFMHASSCKRILDSFAQHRKHKANKVTLTR